MKLCLTVVDTAKEAGNRVVGTMLVDFPCAGNSTRIVVEAVPCPSVLEEILGPFTGRVFTNVELHQAFAKQGVPKKPRKNLDFAFDVETPGHKDKAKLTIASSFGHVLRIRTSSGWKCGACQTEWEGPAEPKPTHCQSKTCGLRLTKDDDHEKHAAS